ncbi:hypothetical protein AGR8A_pTi10045 [Agrobacterium fabrum str. J-07]|nr:hypothetical protein AGR8A_pTi10045 [Agrobacterium fabrum str. J-07]
MTNSISMAAGPGSFPSPFGIHLSWPYVRRTHQFVVRVVEPSRYEPKEHAGLFNQLVIGGMLPTSAKLDPYDFPIGIEPRDQYDLITFPEAFVSADALLSVLRVLPGNKPSGCVHVGLRPSADDENHLFEASVALQLIQALTSVFPKAGQDLAAVTAWLELQKPNMRLNLACIFLIDADGELRICIQPKFVRSRVETSALSQHHMDEGDLLSLLTLVPADPRFATVSLHPLICSDFLDIGSDRHFESPIAAVTKYAGHFDNRPPDHIDIVSVATCTPQKKARTPSGSYVSTWHEKFLEAFIACAERPAFARHHFAAVVLANFGKVPGSKPGGLSGVFLPVKPQWAELAAPGVRISSWGKPDATSQENNQWSPPLPGIPEKWSGRGFITAVDPGDDIKGHDALIFHFTIQRLPRGNSMWTPYEGLTQCEVRVGCRDESGTWAFNRI